MNQILTFLHHKEMNEFSKLRQLFYININSHFKILLNLLVKYSAVKGAFSELRKNKFV